MRRARIALASLVFVASAGCKHPDGAAPGGSATATTASSSGAPPSTRLAEIEKAELTRRPGGITEADLGSRDLAVRRAAARALARIGGEPTHAGLLRAIGDEDAEVVTWAAYGLGYSCKGHERENVSALVVHALDRARAEREEADAGVMGARLDADAAIARAIGRCGADESEPTLVAWLGSSRARAAALGLGDFATAKERLRQETIVALLNAAAGSASSPPLPEALYPIARLEHPPADVIARLRDVASARLANAGESRIFAVRALGRGGPDAAVDLARVLGDASFTPSERAEAAHMLKRLGRAGASGLGDTLPQLVPSTDPVALTALAGEDTGVLLAAIESLDALINADDGKVAPSPRARKALADLAALPLPQGAPATLARRLSWIRCAAARALAGDDFRDKALLACDVGHDAQLVAGATPPADAPKDLPATSIGARATLAVIARAEIVGPRLAAFNRYALGEELRAREEAFDVLEQHEEIDARPIIVAGLSAKEAGLVASAAEVLAKASERASAPSKDAGKRHKKKREHEKREKSDKAKVAGSEPSPEVVKALLAAFDRPEIGKDPEITDGLVAAAGALGLDATKAKIDALCGSPYPTTRERARLALQELGTKKTCDAPAEGPVPSELEHVVTSATTIAFDTDAGAMTIELDPAIAPAFVTRVVDLVKKGYYDGMIVHRVVPGFVTQFGAPHGDGFGGPDGLASLPCETSPLPFTKLAVGVALSGRDTGSSQLFVMHARAPHLDGGYTLVGTATGAWAAFVDGDRIIKATIR